MLQTENIFEPCVKLEITWSINDFETLWNKPRINRA